MADRKGSRKMSASQPTVSALARAFETVTTDHQKNLTKVRDAALQHKTECAQRHDELLKDLQTHLDSLTALMTDMLPKIRQLQQLDKKPTATKPPVKTSHAKGRA